MTTKRRESRLEPYREYGPLFIRLVVGGRLIWGTQDNVFSWERMKEFAAFLGQHGVPYPLAGAVLSVAVQFLAGLLVIVGLWTRTAGALIVLNFIAAFWIAHRGDTFLDMYDALVMLAGGLFFLLHGPGRLSLDSLRERRRIEPMPRGEA